MAVTQSTTDYIKLGAAADSITGKKFVKKILWSGPTTAGHQLVLQDAAGNTFVDVKCGLANESVQLDFNVTSLRIDGCTVQTMGSGSVFLYLE
jgi:hypothetical protein